METNGIYACASHRDFLKSYLASRKNSLGLRTLARKAGFKSAGHVTMLINGERRLTARSADLLAKALELKGRQKSLLLAFARLDSGRSEKEKNQAREEILKLKSFRPEFKLSAKHYSFLATWYYPALFALLQNVPSGKSPAQLARHLGRGVTTAAVEQALSDLHFLGLIAKDDKGDWRPVNATITTPDEVRDLAIGQYHRNMLGLAETALALPLEKREFNGLTVTVPQRLLPQVKEKIRRFRSELNEMMAGETAAADVYQLNLQFFPLTEGLERKDG
jgi:uncharacterized protein (TIGR02147 family)